jgi:hypothetical protein
VLCGSSRPTVLCTLCRPLSLSLSLSLSRSLALHFMSSSLTLTVGVGRQVALSGGHTLGRMHEVRSGFDGPWTHTPLKFDNSYYQLLMVGAPPLLRLHGVGLWWEIRLHGVGLWWEIRLHGVGLWWET